MLKPPLRERVIGPDGRVFGDSATAELAASSSVAAFRLTMMVVGPDVVFGTCTTGVSCNWQEFEAVRAKSRCGPLR